MEEFIGEIPYEIRDIYACDVCGNRPDDDGMIEHGRGCYTQSEDGGGFSHVDPWPPKEFADAIQPPEANAMEDFWNALESWSESTFGSRAQRGPTGPIKHLRKECDEVLANPTDLEEYADLQFLVFDATRRAGFTYDQLMNAIWAKLTKNKARQWPTPTGDEPVEHIRHELGGES